MPAFYSYLSWFDPEGTEHRLPGFDSGKNTLGSDDECEQGERSRHVDERYGGMLPKTAILARAGGDYPTTYQVHPASLIELFEQAPRYQLKDLTVEGSPVDAAARIAELRTLPPNTIIHVTEWDQS